MTNNLHLGASFRDPSGFLFVRDGALYRQVNRLYQKDYDLLMQSGLYERLVKAKKLIPHQEVDIPAAVPECAYCILEPQRVEFISYPYEWSFSQLKDAALLTLSIQKIALEFGLSLKDASAYNIQFHAGRPLLIDTLSFEAYRAGEPWAAYRQFCQHFLAPLALMSCVDIRLSQWMRVSIDGIPLDLASRLLPLQTRFQFGLMAHIHLHASAQKRYAAQPDAAQKQASGREMGKEGLLGLIDSLTRTISGLRWEPKGTEWGDYYDATNYTRVAFDHKMQVVKSFLERIHPHQVWDLGANTGVFSRLAAEMGIFTIASDIDEAAVEKNYREMKKGKEPNLLPLVIDLTNPSPAIGWNNHERDSFLDRGPVDTVMALALVHHLAISNNVPLADLAEFFAGIGHSLIVEFIPKEDSQVKRLLTTRKDIFPDYTREGFERAFSQAFILQEIAPIQESQRVMYLMQKRETNL
jgi:ribosomal protein L11 methylase PrmA